MEQSPLPLLCLFFFFARPSVCLSLSLSLLFLYHLYSSQTRYNKSNPGETRSQLNDAAITRNPLDLDILEITSSQLW
ncbi:uncharacterized protein BX664DRAFT_344323 [Halteromyces radiatus]|uniref:uncharacterized protein n=1 Tax=Halteromyces radiatus TaxID=101107 RepID=UPI00221E7078|nr:uncharacterized protein BX664DRAFT_344323 [Halteromyces radiatus]KAI8076311.1 hypothetical protein BX664DRAFT_344323 [Halteromyces radiatus]